MHGVRGAEPQRLLAARLDRVDDDDRLGAGDPRALHDELAHAARADHERDAARLRARREQHGTDARQRRAAEQRRVAQRHGAAGRQGDLRGDDDPLGPGAGRRAAVHRLAVERHPRRAVDERPVADRAVERHAGGGPAARAVGAVAARRRPREHDLVPDPHRVDRVAGVLDDPGALVPEHHRRRPLPLALHLVEVGAADPDRRHADDDVVRAGLCQIELDDLERLADCPEEPGPRLHPYAPIAAFTAAQFVTVETFWSA